MNQVRCRLAEIVSAMPEKTSGRIFCHRGSKLAEITYAECYRDATAVMAALRARGVRPGDRVAIHGETSYEWVLADLACLLAGAVSVALYPSAPFSRAASTARESGCRVIFTDRAKLAAGFAAAGLEVILLSTPEDGDGTPSVAASLSSGNDPVLPSATDRGDGPFTMVSTSGTLSEPKLFAVHSAPLLYTMDRFCQLYELSARDRLLLYLPLSHLPQRMMLYGGLDMGMDFVLSAPAHMAADTAERAPTLHVAVPRSLAHLHRRALMTAQRESRPVTAQDFRAVFGHGMRAIFVGSAASDRVVLADLVQAGLPVYEVYGATELGMIALNTPGARRIGTVGRAIPWGEIRIDHENDEVLVQTPTPFLYGQLIEGDIVAVHDDPAQWRRTGDTGTLDAEGFLTIRGRLRDFVPLSNGEKVFLTPIEEALIAGTGASVCVVSQAPAGHLRALLFYDPAENDEIRSHQHAPSRLGFAEARNSEVCKVNQTLHPWERIKEFSVVDRVPSIEEGTLTETMKIRRRKIDEVYAAQVTWHKAGENEMRTAT
jgi:long-chain acyl-CoA synthetase